MNLVLRLVSSIVHIPVCRSLPSKYFASFANKAHSCCPGDPFIKSPEDFDKVDQIPLRENEHLLPIRKANFKFRLLKSD